MSILRRRPPAPLLAAMALLCAVPLRAQEPAALQGTARDAATQRPLHGAIITLRPQQGPARVTRTDETGGFAFSRVAPGPYSLGVQRLGYEPWLRQLEVTDGIAPVIVTMARMQQLDTVRVRAARQAIYGAVARARDMQPLTDAYVQVFGTSATTRVKVDSSGHFFIPIRTPGPYVVRATARHYAANTVSVTVPPNDGSEVAMLLDTASAANNRLEMAFSDFRDRMIRQRQGSTIVPRTEVLRNAGADLLTALQMSPSFVRKNLRFGETACLFVDGRPRAGVSIKAVDPASVEAVEVYSASGEASGTLARTWPRGMPCGDTGIGRTAPGTDLVRWVSVWTRQ